DPRSPSPRPPRWAERLLGILVPGRIEASLEEDLRERFGAIAEEEGPERARRWYRRQVLSAAQPMTLWALWRGGPERRRRNGGHAMAWIEQAGQDVLHALRRMRRAPAATAAALLMLAIGVGGGTGVYGIHRAFQDLTTAGLPDPDRIRVATLRDARGRLDSRLPARVAATLLDRAPTARASLASVDRRLLRVGDDAQLRAVASVTPGHFRVMGAGTTLGRGILPDDVGTPVLVLSHATWRDRLGADPHVLGRIVHLDRQPHTVIGVAAEDFVDLGFVSAWTPLGPGSPEVDAASVVVDVDGLGPEIEALEARLDAAAAAVWPDDGGPGALELATIGELGATAERGSILATFAILGALSLLVLLAASANVANLVTAQVLARRRELALRRSLGASRGRVTRLLVTELLVLGLLAGGGAMAVVAGLARLVPAWLPPSTANVVEFQVRIGHLWIALGLSVLAALLSAVLPALRTPPTDAALRSGPGPGEGPGRAQRGLVVVQVACSVLLLGTAGLLVRSTTNLRSLDHGLVPDGGSVLTFAFPEHLYGPDAVDAFLREMLPEIAALPGVDRVAVVSPSPVIGAAGTRIGTPARPDGMAARRLEVSPGYFPAMGTALLAGRAPGGEGEAVVTADLAERLWPGESPLGRPAVVGGREVRIVGVAEEGVYGTASLQPHVFLPLDGTDARNFTLVLRGTSGSGASVATVRSIIRTWDPDLPVNSLGTLDDLLDRAQVLRRAASGLAAVLGVLALVIAVVGSYA
ncbi:MAG TPA: ABC transporter permease, partial [Longimicrobiales bacterium]|nr:ABC transporter permease [Longimicrobiales bacterium]